MITDHLANQPLWGVTCQSHTKTHIHADETSSFKTCFSSCLHSSLQFWLSPQKGLPPKIETYKSWVSKSKISEPKKDPENRPSSIIHQLLTHSEIIGWVLYDITSLTKTNPSQGPKHNKKSKKSKKKSKKNKHQSQKRLKRLRFLSEVVFLFVSVGQSLSCGEILRSHPGFPRFSRPTRACRMVAWNKWWTRWTLQMGHVFRTCLLDMSFGHVFLQLLQVAMQSCGKRSSWSFGSATSWNMVKLGSKACNSHKAAVSWPTLALVK